MVFLYAGASALAGYETVNWGEKTLYDGARLDNGDACHTEYGIGVKFIIN